MSIGTSQPFPGATAPTWCTPDQSSETVELWHGCTQANLTSIMLHGVDPTRGSPASDFGRGFYTTTWERQARAWAWEQSLSASPATRGPTNPVVVCFVVERRDLASLEALSFASGSYYESAGYWSLVQHCRQSASGVIRNHKCTNSPSPVRRNWYDIVVGPVAAFWRQRVAMADADQVSFHTTRSARVLNDLIAQYRLGLQPRAIHMDWVAVTP
jgi:hypothetical protein